MADILKKWAFLLLVTAVRFPEAGVQGNIFCRLTALFFLKPFPVGKTEWFQYCSIVFLVIHTATKQNIRFSPWHEHVYRTNFRYPFLVPPHELINKPQVSIQHTHTTAAQNQLVEHPICFLFNRGTATASPACKETPAGACRRQPSYQSCCTSTAPSGGLRW